MWFTIFLVGAAVALVYHYFQNIYNYWERRNVPNERPLPLVGNMQGIGRTKHFRDVNQRIYDQFKGKTPIAGMFLFFKRAALIIDLDFIKQVLIKDFTVFHDRGVFSNVEDDPLTGHLLTLEGDEWRSMRNKLSPVFSSGKIKHMSKVVVDVGRHLISVMETAVKAAAVDDSEVEIKEYCARFTTDVIGSCAFGLECNSLNDPKAEFRKKGRMLFEQPRYSQLVTLFIFTNPKLAKKLHLKALPDELSEFFLKAVRDTVDYRIKNGVQRNDFLDQLIELKAANEELAKQGNGIDLSLGLTIEQMAAQSFVFFIAGFETSSSTMAFCLYELALHQDIQQRLRDEINTVLSGVENQELTYDAITQMTYLDKVLAETLRKYPVLSQLIREARQDYKFPESELVIEKGTSVLIPVHNIHHDPELYPEPERFDPSRFDPEMVKNRHPCAYLPFGDGPRNCIGLRFGKMQAKIGLISLLRNFRFSASKKTEIPLVFSKKTPTLSTEHGIHLKVERI
ncbi:probable cytochrome P450 6a14 [Drosophila tropicalis]|uniref:probable cytochrome P450 6a14 n=1 Tax=Drosophila tropicalis TaxID=46794 RepID=UPI0035AB9BE8